MEQIVKFDHIYQYNESRGVETLHPLVNVIDFSTCGAARYQREVYGFYTIYLKEVKCGDLRYGRNYYGLSGGDARLPRTPGRSSDTRTTARPTSPKAGRCSSIPTCYAAPRSDATCPPIRSFSYEVNEALHLSEQERGVVLDCLRNIRSELAARHRQAQPHAHRFEHRAMLLNYCTRFYERQFITRGHVNRDVLTGFERLLNDYFADDRPQRDGFRRSAGAPSNSTSRPTISGIWSRQETGKSARSTSS